MLRIATALDCYSKHCTYIGPSMHVRMFLLGVDSQWRYVRRWKNNAFEVILRTCADIISKNLPCKLSIFLNWITMPMSIIPEQFIHAPTHTHCI